MDEGRVLHPRAIHRLLERDREAGESIGDVVVLPGLRFEEDVGPYHLLPQPLQLAVNAL